MSRGGAARVAERYGHRIRRVVRLRAPLFRVQYALYHVDDLALFRAAIADDGLLHLQGRILVHRHPGSGSRRAV